MVAASTLFPGTRAMAASGGKLKLAVVGCGGRSHRNIADFIKACELLGLEAEIVALADAFEDRVIAASEKYGVDRSRCHAGWDAYQKIAESDAGYVMLVTPPLFRPVHFDMMVEAGKHVFMEKPVAVDAPGCRKIIAIGEEAKRKGLSVVAGTQRRHQLNYLKNKALIEAGAIGDILGGTISWNGTVPWIWERESGWSDADYMARNWLNWMEVSGDHICEQHVHNIDVANWFLGRLPVSVIGFGGRARRETGNCYDFFSLDLDYGNGVNIHSQCRQISGTYQRIGEFFRGSKGEVYGGGRLNGIEVSVPEIKVLHEDGQVQEMVAWIRSARSGDPLNEARQVAESTAVSIMGRQAAYTGKLYRLNDMMNNPESEIYQMACVVQAEDFEKGTVKMPPENVVPIPGDGAPIRRRT